MYPVQSVNHQSGCTTEDTMRADLAALGYRLGWARADDSEKDALAKVADRLRQEGEGILLIFDKSATRDRRHDRRSAVEDERVLQRARLTGAETQKSSVWRGDRRSSSGQRDATTGRGWR